MENRGERTPVGFERRGGGGPGRFMPVAKPKDFKGTLLRIWEYFGGERRILLAVFLLIFLSTGVGLLIPFLIGKAIDAMTGGKEAVDFVILRIVTLSLMAIYVADSAVNFLQGFIMAGVSQRIVEGLRKNLFDKLQRLPVAFFDTHAHGDVMSRLSNDIDNISNTISQAATQLMTSGITIVGTLMMMLWLSPVMTLASLITVPLIFLLTKAITGRTRVMFKDQQSILGKLNGQIEETISGIQVIKAFGREERIIEDFEGINLKLCETGTRANMWSGFIMPLSNIVNNIGFTVVASVGGVLAVNEAITVGTIASFLSYSRQFARPINELANIYNTLQSAVAGAERVFEIIDEEEEKGDTDEAETLNSPCGHVVFENVTFGYKPGVPILNNISLEAEAGSTIALVGPTGAGKTTIVNLLSRFYDVNEGRIIIDGTDIREYTRDSLRRCFGIVLQDTYLFSGTIRENIRYGRLDASDSEVEEAAKMSNAEIFIKRLPKGYDTMLSESGSNLSQGQRQLLAIARAILSNPSILILDEATSSVDTLTELHIQEAMLKLMAGRTSFIIAHRLSTIRDADVIMVIDKGEIVESGNHDSLIAKGGVYSNLYFSQFKNLQRQ